MIPIPFFLADFKKAVKNYAYNSETNPHPVFYFETKEVIYFYKIIKSVLYYTSISTLVEEGKNPIDISGLKLEFSPIVELPEQLLKPKQFQGIIS